METHNNTEKEKFRTSAGLFEVLIEMFKLQNNKTVLPLQYCKLMREQNENAKKWMG